MHEFKAIVELDFRFSLPDTCLPAGQADRIFLPTGSEHNCQILGRTSLLFPFSFYL